MDKSDPKRFVASFISEARRLSALIGASEAELPKDAPCQDGKWIDLCWREAADGDDEDGWCMSLMQNEDGHDWELSEVEVAHADYLLYVLFDELTGKLARAQSGDDRHAWFARQEELLGRLSEEWRLRTARRHTEMLAKFP